MNSRQFTVLAFILLSIPGTMVYQTLKVPKTLEVTAHGAPTVCECTAGKVFHEPPEPWRFVLPIAKGGGTRVTLEFVGDTKVDWLPGYFTQAIQKGAEEGTQEVVAYADIQGEANVDLSIPPAVGWVRVTLGEQPSFTIWP